VRYDTAPHLKIQTREVHHRLKKVTDTKLTVGFSFAVPRLSRDRKYVIAPIASNKL
jgi:hypothetical protein